ncbi:hypothetical protein [Roseomonas chloroacetimidivorans]|uniref:hypothetical protein n=1 Tax=Roseomonas chloroacetimidivorans TaxID=1766656 RepID=UPI003C7116DF
MSVNGENYLPDFLVTLAGKNITHEVKPENEWARIQAPRVYLAGKMSAEHEWRGEASVTDRNRRAGIEDELSPVAWLDAARLAWMDDAALMQVGPFPGSCDHGCGHMPDNLHMAQTCMGEHEATIFETCLNTIRHSDVVCAHLSSGDAFGTIVEIGLARAMAHRPVVSVSLSMSLAASYERRPGPDHNTIGTTDLWFIQAAGHSSAVVFDLPEAWRFHAKQIRAATPREYRLISALGRSSNSAVMTFGDPLHVAENRYVHNFGTDFMDLCVGNRGAAEAARAHRFDGR